MKSPLPRRRSLPLALVATAGLAVAACGAEPTAGVGATADVPAPATAAPVRVTFEPNRLGISSAAELPDPCALIPASLLRIQLGSAPTPVRGDGFERQGEALLYRSCELGDATGDRAVGIQIGVPNEVGRDVVYNRSTALDPALHSEVGDDARGTMNVAVMPSGGTRGASLFFRYGGYSVLIARTGPASSLGGVEELGVAVIATLAAAGA